MNLRAGRNIPPPARLDAEVRQVTPSLRKKAETRSTASPAPRSKAPLAQRIYLVVFDSTGAAPERFIKVGISRLDLLARFQRDWRNYSFRIIARSALIGTDALLMEAALHAAFASERYRPRVPLAAGNTECYRYSEETLARMSEIIKGL